jgi:hypothetical protein
MYQMVDEYYHHKDAVNADYNGYPENRNSQVGEHLSGLEHGKPMAEKLNCKYSEQNKGGDPE